MLYPVRAEAKGSSDPRNTDMMPGIILSQGKVWQEQRRFMIRVFNSVFKDQSSQKMIMGDIYDLLSQVRESLSKPVELHLHIDMLIAKFLLKLCTGENSELNDRKDSNNLLDILLLVKAYVQNRSQTAYKYISVHPSIATFLKSCWFWKGDGALKEVLTFVKQNIISQTNSAKPCDGEGCFSVRYIEKIKQQSVSEQELSFVGQNGYVNLTNVIQEILFAGSHATSMMLKWALLLMIQNPDAQEKVYQELITNIGIDIGVPPCILDRKKTPYTQAVLTEVSRLASVSDQGVPHRATKDLYLSTGHYIPKDTMIILWFGEAMRDPKHFPEPDKFDPSRFIDNTTGSFVPHPALIRFGLGKRRCPGEAIAQDLVYLVFTNIVSQFRLERAQDHEHLAHSNSKTVVFLHVRSN